MSTLRPSCCVNSGDDHGCPAITRHPAHGSPMRGAQCTCISYTLLRCPSQNWSSQKGCPLSEVTSEDGEQRGRLRKSGFSPSEPSSHGGQPLPTTPCHPGRRRRSRSCGGSRRGLPTQILSQMAAALAQSGNGARQDTHSPTAPDLSLPARTWFPPTSPTETHVLCLWALTHHSLPSLHTSSREPSCVAPGFRAPLSLKVLSPNKPQMVPLPAAMLPQTPPPHAPARSKKFSTISVQTWIHRGLLVNNAGSWAQTPEVLTPQNWGAGVKEKKWGGGGGSMSIPPSPQYGKPVREPSIATG